MMHPVFSVAALASVLASSGCSPNAESVGLSFQGSAFGTTFSVKFGQGIAQAEASKVSSLTSERLAEIDEIFSNYRADSEISRFNDTESTDWVSVSAEFVAVVQAAQDVSRDTGGAFDITIGPLVSLWNFGPGEVTADDRFSDSRSTSFEPPDDESITATRAFVGYEKLEVRRDPPALRKSDPRLQIDLSAIAKGYAVDEVSRVIADRGIADFMVEIGGEVFASGQSGRGGPWRIAVETPTPGERGIQRVVHLRDVALATSGDYRNFYEKDGRRFSHLIDPRTGRPIKHALASVSIVSDDCLTADAWATAISVLGPEDGFAAAESRGLAAFLLVRPDETVREPVERATENFSKLLQPR